MTREYSDINQHDALYNTARIYPGGVEALAARMSTPERRLSANVLRNKLRPSIDTHHATFEEVSQLIELAEESRVPAAFAALHAFCWRHGHVAVQLPGVPGDDDHAVEALMRQVMQCVGVEGQLFRDLNAALADDRRIDRRELAAIELNLEDLFGCLAVLRDKVRAKHAADYPTAA